MIPDMGDPEHQRLFKEAGRAMGGCGAHWDAAVEMGIDVMLLAENLRVSPAERIAQMDEQNRLAADIQRRSVPEFVRKAMAQRELDAKRRALDPEQ